MTQLGRLWRTVRWLKPAQVLGRVRFRLQRPSLDLRPPPPLRPPASGAWVRPPARLPSLLSPTRMRFLGQEHDLAAVGWDEPTLPLLWRYNQHYFDDLHAIDASARREWHRQLVTRWLADNPAGRGTAWAPYPSSLRIVNWVRWFLAGQPPEPTWLASLAVQVRWLTRRLEWHLLGNHLFVNAKALVCAGLFFEGHEAEGWLGEGLRILEQQLPEQVLADGAQFERSPMYHALALEDVLDLLNLIAARAQATSPALRLVPQLRRRASDMLHWLRCLRHPGGMLARFNDTAEGIAPATDDIERYAADLGIVAPAAPGEGVLALQPSGYVRAVRGAATALLDVAPIGPDYLPGHAHADTLSFELSVQGQELIVNRGTSVYGDGPRRQLERGTAAHSTVQVGAHDSSEVWAGFRVGRRARPFDVTVDGWRIGAAHDGYAHLPGKPQHRREWTLEADALLVHDHVEPDPEEPCVARYHLAPGLGCEPAQGGHWIVRRGGDELARVQVLRGRGALESWQHAQRFGELVPAQTLAVQLDAGVAEVRWHWST
ncbi:MAG: alginate lyase family protein [Burkholderiales bacterium]|nr:alginate lyase family protein [Burkholderiales bacterium]